MMLVNIPEYQVIDQIYDGTNSLVYRGIRRQDNLPVILKVLNAEFPTIQVIGRYKLEYEITKSFNSKFVIKVYDFRRYQNSFVIILEDFGGVSLAQFLHNQNIDIAETLKLAIKISEGLSHVHRSNIIHKDLNPSNIVFNPVTGQLKLIDFGIASALPKETLVLDHHDILEGTLAYISPEQTGRMNRSLDYRTDIYSMGVTFYQMFTGVLPFISNNPLEVIHYHLALEPVAPYLINRHIPQILSRVIVKMLAKNAEERYQSAWGVKADLEQCLYQLQIKGEIDSFDLAQQDVTDKFIIPEKLYGRSREIESLLATFTRVTDQPKDESSETVPEMILVSGYAGIGKSRLVKEIHRIIVQNDGYFISGKFDQYQCNIPYLAIIQAFQSLIKHLLTENEDRLNLWRSRILTSLGSNSYLITQVIPDLELIIGKQADHVAISSNLSVNESQNRFNRIFQNFIRIFAQAEHPLVIFLDDLQWADLASLKLLQILATTSSQQSLLLIGAYRDNEVNSTHPIMHMVENIQQANGIISQLYLSPLNLTDITQFTANALHCSSITALPLAELIQQKTEGNPFFMNEFLKSLYDEKLIRFDYHSRQWQWSITQIQDQGITDNVVLLMTAKIQRLNDRTQRLLQIASCIGNQFDLDILVLASELSYVETIQSLVYAIAEGLIITVGNVNQSLFYGMELTSDRPQILYKFAHDRIQQAAYLLIPEADKPVLHYRICRLLLEQTADSAEQLENQIFIIVSQFRLGNLQVTNQQERDHLIQLNLLAGRKARLSYAYESSVQYCETGLQLLAEDAWIQHPRMTEKLHLEAITSSFLAGKFELVDQIMEVIKPWIPLIHDRVKFIEVQIQSLIARNRLSEAIAIALDVLQQLGVTIPQNPTELEIQNAFQVVSQRLVATENVLDLPNMSDPQKLAAINILSNMSSATYIGFPALYPLVVLKQVELSLQFGTTLETAYAFSTYGLILCVTGEIEIGNQSADIALALMEKFQAYNFKAKIFNLIYHFVRPWKQPAYHSMIPLLEGYQAGVESGDLEFASYCLFNHCQISYWSGTNLLKLKQDMETYGEAIAKSKQAIALNFHQIGHQAVLNWLGETENSLVLTGEVYNEIERLPLHLAAGDTYSTATAYVQKLILSYHFGKPQDTLAIAELANQSISGATGAIQFGAFYFYHALALLANLEIVSDQIVNEAISYDLNKLSVWASHAPTNFAHRCELVRAEMARVLGQRMEAMDLYDRAIALAKEHHYIHEEALANELAAKFYLSQGKITIAKAYMREARYCYLQWGAVAKLQYLETHYADTLDVFSSYQKSTLSPNLKNLTQSSSSELDNLDLESVLRSSQAIASEIKLEELMATLMNILIENAGAQTCYLLLPVDLASLGNSSQSQWKIEAIKDIGYEQVVVQSIPLDEVSVDGYPYVPVSLVNYVIRTHERVVLNNAIQSGDFRNDPWIVNYQVKSLLCLPLINRGNLSAIVILENNLINDAFTPERLALLNLLSTQAAISISKARLLKQQSEFNQSLQAEICDRQVAEKERDRLIAIIQASTDFIGIVSPRGEVLWTNSQANRYQSPYLDPETNLYIPNCHPQWALEIIQKQGIPTAINEGIWVGETALLTKEGIEVPVSQMIIAHKSSQGELEYISTIMRDISEAKERESALKKSETTLQNLVTGTAAVTGKDFFPALVKHIAEALHVKYAVITELIGNELHTLASCADGIMLPPTTYFTAYTPCELALLNGEFICNSSVQQAFPENETLVLMQADSYMGTSLKDASGNPIGNLSILDVQPIQDIQRARNILQVFAARAAAELQQKTTNEALSQLNQSLEARVKQRTAQLEAANQELESFAYSVSHDLRAPLRAVDGFSRMLQEDYGDRLDDEGNRFLKIVRDNAKRMGELIDDLLNLSRLNRKEMVRRSISINDLVQQLLDEFTSELASRQIEFILADLPDCQADVSLLTQVWINLLSNAIKYTGKTENAQIEIGFQIIDEEIVYFIRDNGAGFDMKYADKLFGVFQRMHLEREFEGTGIGLAIVQRIVQRHGGRIWAEAAVNQGATFYFTIPN
ncbi:AAA family ATPase [Pseudanabaena yagii]|nr:AAA family ATPase [Pseudanabaena yagii]